MTFGEFKTQRVGPRLDPEMLRRPVLSVAELHAAGIPIETRKYATIGAGLGSFVWVDFLRCGGADWRTIAAIGRNPKPYQQYEYLCKNSQIPDHERLRSDSAGCPDNLWAFPSYAVREARAALSRGDTKGFFKPLWRVFGEPTFTGGAVFTPRSGDVFRAIDRESDRIGYHAMHMPGIARAIRKAAEGGFLVVVSPLNLGMIQHIVVHAWHLHMSVGYPALQFLPDLQRYRTTYDDQVRVVNAYEPHQHVYEDIQRAGGTVLVRGRGIVASRIIQRLWEARAVNPNIAIIHLFRGYTPPGQGTRYGRSKRRDHGGFELQNFNWPKSNWTGMSRRHMEGADDARRAQLLEVWGGSTTAERPDWKRIVEQGLREGWYRQEIGDVHSVMPDDQGRVVTVINSRRPGGGTLELHADYIIDSTGLVGDVTRHELLKDLLTTYALPRNPLGRLRPSPDMELVEMRNGGRFFVAGNSTLGGPYAPVDSFLGLQYVAFRSYDELAQLEPELRPLTPRNSIAAWRRHRKGVHP